MSTQMMVLLGIQILLIHREVYCTFCPAPCQCVFSDTINENYGFCEWKSSSVNISWIRDKYYPSSSDDSLTRPVLSITCQGTNYTYVDLPQFNISQNNVKLSVTSCGLNILRCLRHISVQPIVIVELDTKDIKGSYTIDDFKELVKVTFLVIHLTDSDTELPTAVLNFLPTLKYIAIIGGNLSENIRFNETHARPISLVLNNNKITSLSDYMFDGIELFTLVVIDNNIENIAAGTLRGQKVLKYFSVKNAGNMLRSIAPSVFSETRYLQVIELDNIALESLPKEMFRGLNALEEVKIINNLIELKLESKMFAYLHFWKLDLVNCKISVLPVDLFEGSNDLVEVDLSDNLIKTLPLKIFWTQASLSIVRLKGNRIKSLPTGIFSKLFSLREIDLSFNHMYEITNDLFLHNLGLQQVLLDNNNITELDLEVFRGKQLTLLSLASNKIQRVVTNGSISLQILELNISDNNISLFEDWTFDTDGMWNLNLSRNYIKTFKESHMFFLQSEDAAIDLRHNNISYIIKDKLIMENSYISDIQAHMFLSNNPLKCDCFVTTLLKKLNNEWKVEDFDDIICENGEYISNIKLYTICNYKETIIGLIGSSIVVSLLLFIILISVLMQRNQIWRNIRRIFKTADDFSTYQMSIDACKTYDVFISFAHQDHVFVTDILLPKLENDFGQNVCVHYRDWIVGDLIPDQIIKSVEDSRKTVIILTKKFLLSDWSYLEFQTAHKLSKQEGYTKVIIILLDDSMIQDDSLTVELKSYIVINSYLMWGDIDFWPKLRRMLPREGKKQKKWQLSK